MIVQGEELRLLVTLLTLQLLADALVQIAPPPIW
jgi:hypothetical protein